MAKKTAESKEAAAERRQRELAALTSGVAAFSLMGDAPRPAAAPTPAPAEPVAAAPVAPASPAPAARQPEDTKAAIAPAAKGAPAKAAAKAAPAQRVGEGPAASAAPAPSPEDDEDEDDDMAEDEVTQPEPVVSAAAGELDLAALFVPSAEKKGTTLRITAEHQQFFTNLGFILGNGASAPDIIHNILNRFREEHEAQIMKAMKKQMRQMMSPRK